MSRLGDALSQAPSERVRNVRDMKIAMAATGIASFVCAQRADRLFGEPRYGRRSFEGRQRAVDDPVPALVVVMPVCSSTMVFSTRSKAIVADGDCLVQCPALLVLAFADDVVTSDTNIPQLVGRPAGRGTQHDSCFS